MEQLLDNALKFHPPVGVPQVTIWGRRLRATELPPDALLFDSACLTYAELCITDNDIGFKEKYLDRIFQIFQRLHSSSNPYGGAGIRLALCCKIVENHEDFITARSEPAGGLLRGCI